MSGVRLGDAIGFLERMAPLEFAEEWDHTGLQVGNPEQVVHKVLVALDPTHSAIEEANRQRCDLLVTHHPLYLKPLKNIDLSIPPGSHLALLISKNISHYAMHTNLDRAARGVNDLLGEALGLLNLRPLDGGEVFFKVAATVPESHLEDVLAAIASEGGGTLGNYSGCAYYNEGVGVFTPLYGAEPFIGVPGRQERTAERRIEVTVAASRVKAVVAAARRDHPYEEPVIDVYPLANAPSTGGLGRIGDLPAPLPLDGFSALVSARLGGAQVRYAGPSGKLVGKVAVCGGAGSSLWRLSMQRGADVLVTGDVRYHEALEAKAAGFSLVDAGHGPTEMVALGGIARLVEEAAMGLGGELKVQIHCEPDPFVNLSP